MDYHDFYTMISAPFPPDGERQISTQKPMGDASQTFPFKAWLEWLEETQEDLRDVREDLVGSRFRLRTKRQELLGTGEKAFSAMGRAFDMTRRYLLNMQLNMPEDVALAGLQVDKIRNDLGEQDVEYEQAEKDHNMEEWQYTEMESRFVQSVQRCRTPHVNSHDPSAPANPFEEPTQLPLKFPEYDIKRNLPMEIGLSHSFSGFPMSGKGSKGRQDICTSLESQSAPITDTTSIFSYLGASLADDLSEMDSQEREYAYHYVPKDNLLSKYDRSDAISDRWSNSRRYIDSWMLDVLKTSSLQKKCLECFVPKGILSDSEWLALVTQYWETDSTNDPVFRTGDTTVSDTSASQGASLDGSKGHFQSSAYCSSDTWQPSGGPMLPDDLVADHQASFDNPVKIRKHDLSDAPQHVSFSTAPSRSYSDQARVIFTDSVNSNSKRHSSAASITTQLKKAFSPSPSNSASINALYLSSTSTGSSSISTIEAEPWFRSLADKHAMSPGEDVPTERVTVPSYFNNAIKVASHSKQSSEDELQRIKASDSHRSRHVHLGSKSQALLQSNVERHTTPECRISTEEANSLLNQRPWSHTRYPFAPFIRVKGSEPWTLPLLRLTPMPDLVYNDLTISRHSSRLENVPFVSISDTPWRLPGPCSSWVV